MSAEPQRRGLILRESFVRGNPQRPIDAAEIEAERLHLAAVTGLDIRYLHCDRMYHDDPMFWHARFIDEVNAVRPDFICYRPNTGLHLIHRNVRPEILYTVRLLYGARLVFVFDDLGSAFHAAYAGGYATIADVAVTADGNTPSLAKLVPDRKIVELWQPVDARIFRDIGAARDVDVCFAGSATDRPDRADMLRALEELGQPVAIRGGKTDYLDTGAYVDLLCRSKISLNFSRGAQGVHQLKRRAIESILCGAVLFESENAITSRYLTPYRHYVPFGDAADLATKIRRYLGNEPARRAIVAAAKSHVATALSEQAWWGKVLADMPPRLEGLAPPTAVAAAP